MKLHELYARAGYQLEGILKLSRLGDLITAEVELDDGRVIHYQRAPKVFLEVGKITRPIRIRFKASTETGAMPVSVLRLA